MRCPIKIGGVECGLETKASRVGHLPNSKGDLVLFDHYECKAGHQWHLNVYEKTIAPCNCEDPANGGSSSAMGV